MTDARQHAIQVVAHRGASEDAPEHTLAAYKKAIEDGADALECDVRLTADGHLVCVHDRRVNRTSNGRGAVSALELSELAALDFGSWKRRAPGADAPGWEEGPDWDASNGPPGTPLSAEDTSVLTLERLLGLIADTDRRIELAIETKHPTRWAGQVEERLLATLRRFGLDAPRPAAGGGGEGSPGHRREEAHKEAHKEDASETAHREDGSGTQPREGGSGAARGGTDAGRPHRPGAGAHGAAARASRAPQRQGGPGAPVGPAGAEAAGTAAGAKSAQYAAVPEPSPVRIMSFSARSLQRVHARAPGLPTVYLMQFVSPRHREGRLPDGVRIAGPSMRIVRNHPGYVTRLKEAGHQVHVWTVNEPADVDLCVALGVDAIITNRPKQVLHRLGRA
ncbi:hypothetical protein GCM10018793_03170 [Streptomyces sulfonofaciens]|uniref:GP-PDE domain-containing protein n=1 Tax=Streptomyces sulfonofaciens TaxID=68272 RepID=A0A919FP14_9ACTN|nr:hypothetical protein GCM10018793_03170 [Streptomyces sulfonofaciens]